jgi:hypothetical protein
MVSIPATDHEAAREAFHEYYPQALRGRFTISYLALGLSALAVVMGTFSLKSKGLYAFLARFDMLLGAVLFCLYLWSLM